MIERFQEALAAETDQRGGLAGTWADPKRRLELPHYLSLFLFGLFNPVVATMRGLCAATELERVQREVCGRPVSLGSFSEAQAVVDPICPRRCSSGWPARPLRSRRHAAPT